MVLNELVTPFTPDTIRRQYREAGVLSVTTSTERSECVPLSEIRFAPDHEIMGRSLLRRARM
jgi:hypothetical protein